MAGGPGGRPARPDQRAVAGVTGVAPSQYGELAERASNSGSQGATRRDHRHGLVAVGHVDVHLGAADQLLADQQLVLVLHLRRSAGPRRCRRRPGRPAAPCPPPRHPRPCGSAAAASRPRSRCRCPRSSSRRAADGRVGLHHRPLQLGRELLAGEVGQQRLGLGGRERRVSRSTTWNSSSTPISRSSPLMTATVRSRCYARVALASPGVAAGARVEAPRSSASAHVGWCTRSERAPVRAGRRPPRPRRHCAHPAATTAASAAWSNWVRYSSA